MLVAARCEAFGDVDHLVYLVQAPFDSVASSKMHLLSFIILDQQEWPLER